MRSCALALLLLAGCAETVAGPAEYAAYRATRVDPTLAARLDAAERYVAKYPQGVWTGEVQAAYAREEALFYKVKRRSVAGLDEYLAALPGGPHSSEARELREALRAKASRGDRLAEQGLLTEARLARASAERAAVRRTMTDWIARFLDAAVFSTPLNAAKGELIVPWRLLLPSPVCRFVEGAPERKEARRRCSKFLELPYVVVPRSGAEPRQATMAIAIVEDVRGVPVEVTLAGPDLFLRLEETVAKKPLEGADGDARIAAIVRAMSLVEGEFRERVSKEASCKKPVVAPISLDMACNGVRVRVRAGGGDGQDDAIVVEAHP